MSDIISTKRGAIFSRLVRQMTLNVEPQSIREIISGRQITPCRKLEPACLPPAGDLALPPQLHKFFGKMPHLHRAEQRLRHKCSRKRQCKSHHKGSSFRLFPDRFIPRPDGTTPAADPGSCLIARACPVSRCPV